MVELWSKTTPEKITNHDGVALRMVRDVPEWAVKFALQGVELVTRYSCPQCETTLAVLARDTD